MARKIKSSYVDAIVSSNSDSFELIILPGKFDVMPGRVLFQGKVVDVKREVSKGGYTVGRCLMEPPASEQKIGAGVVEKRHLVVPFQNEFQCLSQFCVS